MLQCYTYLAAITFIIHHYVYRLSLWFNQSRYRARVLVLAAGTASFSCHLCMFAMRSCGFMPVERSDQPRNLNCWWPCALLTSRSFTPLPSTRPHSSYGDCLEVKREYYQNCSVLDCVTQCSQSTAHLCEQFLQVQQIGFVTLGPLRCA